jgi:hypothetical protein
MMGEQPGDEERRLSVDEGLYAMKFKVGQCVAVFRLLTSLSIIEKQLIFGRCK